TSHEVFWRDLQPWLKENGYMLRPRFQLDWQPSWRPDEYARSHEDGIFTMIPQIMDATRISDGRTVILKHVIPDRDPLEIDTTIFFSLGERALDPRNHCVPVFNKLDIPDSDECILVFPLLRRYDNPPFETVGDIFRTYKYIAKGYKSFPTPPKDSRVTFCGYRSVL
ncbi:hypothetical protein C8Q75DRAFT_716107, partial [Abortiporus biennis]